MTKNFSEGVALSEKLRSVPLSKLERKATSGEVVGFEIYLEIVKVFKLTNSDQVVHYLGPQSLGDQLKVAIDELKIKKIDDAPLSESIARINKLI